MEIIHECHVLCMAMFTKHASKLLHSLFLFIAQQYFVVQRQHSLFKYSHVDRHLNCSEVRGRPHFGRGYIGDFLSLPSAVSSTLQLLCSCELCLGFLKPMTANKPTGTCPQAKPLRQETHPRLVQPLLVFVCVTVPS